MGLTRRSVARRWDGLLARLLARLLRAQLLARAAVARDTDPSDGDTWQARLIRAGLALAGAGTLALTAWLRRHR